MKARILCAALAVVLAASAVPTTDASAQGRDGRDRDRDWRDRDWRDRDWRDRDNDDRDRRGDWRDGDRWRGRDDWRGNDRHWQDRDIRRFSQRDLNRWRTGVWRQGSRDGRHGWWWVVNGIWYPYPVPSYPYPDPYQPPVLTGPPPSVPQVYYYCENPRGYYPYVPGCPSGWRQVPAG